MESYGGDVVFRVIAHVGSVHANSRNPVAIFMCLELIVLWHPQ